MVSLLQSINDIKIDYENGMAVTLMSKKYDVPYATINKFLINNHIKTVRHYKIQNDKINAIIDMLKEQKTTKEIQSQLKCSYDTINAIAKQCGLPMFDAMPPRRDINKNFDDNYFHNIDTENKAYFLGLIYTDGNVRIHNNGYFLSINLQIQDKYILEKLASELKCGNTIYERNRVTNFASSHSATFTTCNSKTMFDDLARFDIIPNKTYKSSSFKNIELIPKDLQRHFIRGIIDGNGSISNISKHDKAISLYSHDRKICDDVDSLLKSLLEYDKLNADIKYIKNDHDGMWFLRYRRINDIKKICTFLYGDATIYLNRKYNNAKEYF